MNREKTKEIVDAHALIPGTAPLIESAIGEALREHEQEIIAWLEQQPVQSGAVVGIIRRVVAYHVPVDAPDLPDGFLGIPAGGIGSRSNALKRSTDGILHRIFLRCGMSAGAKYRG